MSDSGTQPSWNDYAAEYETVHEPLTGQFAAAALAHLPVSAGQRVLDIAAGPGTLALLAARASALVVATDASPRMVERAAARLRDAGAAAETHVMDATRLDFAASAFDAVFCVFGIMVIPDYRAALAEMARVTRPGGGAAVVMWHGLEHMEHVQVWLEAIAAAFPSFEPTPPPANWRVLQDPNSLAALMREAGFARVESHLETCWWEVASPAWFARHADLSPAAAMLYRTLGHEACATVRRVLEVRLRDRHGDGPFRLAAQAHIVVGRR